MTDVQRSLEERLGSGAVRVSEPMADHTTFRIGGPADLYVEPADAEALAAAAEICRRAGAPFYILGNGSDLLVSDEGYRGVMIATKKLRACQADRETGRVRAEAGILLSALARGALEASLTGLEFAAGIPGSLGGAVVMNAGAYGSEMKDVLVSADVLTPEGEILTLTPEELDLGYRRSCIPGRGYIVLAAEFQLKKGDPAAIREYMDDLASRRRSKQPLEYPSAGSTFKRPEGHFAGKLIDDAGLRGFTVGGAQVSEKHCGFVINRDHATAEDVMELCRAVQTKVKETFGVELEMEVRFLQ